MTYSEFFRDFVEIEQRLGLCHARDGDFAYWDYLRVPVSQKISSSLGIMARAGGQKEKERSVKKFRLFSQLENRLLRGLGTFSDCEFLFIGPGAMRRKTGKDGLDWDLWCDPLIQVLGEERCVLLEKPEKGFHRKQSRTRNLASTDSIDWKKRRYRMGRWVKPKGEVCSAETKRMLSNLQSEFEKSFGLEKGLLNLEKLFVSSKMRREETLPVLKKEFSRLKLKAVFLVNSYSGRERYIEAARALNIPIVELQHGLISKFHFGYSYPEESFKTVVPNFFYSFGKYWEESVELPVPLERIFTIGYPYLENTLSEFERKKERTRQVVFISQGAIGDRLSTFAADLQDRLPGGWKIVYKLHPREVNGWRERYSRLSESGIQVVEKDEPSLYQLFSESDIQIGVYSTALFEGIAFGCKTVLVDLPGVESLLPLVEKGVAELVSQPSEVDFEGLEEGVLQKDLFFADDWQKNFQAAEPLKEMPSSK